jgi:hypothetical protein
MTPLREQLDQARKQYAAEKYPGDLAADVLGRHRPHVLFRIGAISAAMAGLAAAVAVWVATRPAPPQSGQPTQTVAIAPTPAPKMTPAPATAGSTDEPTDVTTALSGFSSATEFPESVPLSPGTAFETSGIGSMPAMPSMDLSFSPAAGGSDGDGSTTKESV